MTANETSLAKLTAVAKAYLADNNISAPFQVSREFVLDLVCKIAKSQMLDGIFEDHFPELDGEYLESARGIEEYYADLVDVKEYSREGSTTLAPAETPHRAPVYSWDSGRRSSKITIWDNELEKGVRSLDELATVIARIMKRLYDSHEVWREKAKIELLDNAAGRVFYEMDAGNADATYASWAAAKTALVAATDGGLGYRFLITGGTSIYKVVNSVLATDTITNEATALASGKIVALNLVTSLAADITDTASGEAFVKSVKKFVKKAKFASEGDSINGTAIGGTPEGYLYLYLDADVLSELEVDVQAGAFHEDKVALPAVIRELPRTLMLDSTKKVLGFIIDTRGVKVHPTHRNVREQDNAEGEFRNYYLHCNYTFVISPNVRMHVWFYDDK